MQELVDTEPELEPFEGFYLKAFWQLLTERRGGHCIPHSEIVKYGERSGLDSDMIESFTAVIWGLDRTYSKWVAGEHERARRMRQKDKTLG